MLATGSAKAQLSGASLDLGLLEDSDNIITAGVTVTVAGSLVYGGTNQGPHDVSDLVFRVSGSLKWDMNELSSLTVADRSVSCTASDGRARCPLNLHSEGVGRITIPSDTPDGMFAISASARVDGQPVSGSLQLTVLTLSGVVAERGSTVVERVAEVRFDFAPDGSGERYPSTIAVGESTKLRLTILNSAGKPVAAGSIASILVETTAGRLSTTVGGGCVGDDAEGSACELPVAAINASNADRLNLMLTHSGGASGSANVQVSVLVQDGSIFVPPLLTVTLAAEALSSRTPNDYSTYLSETATTASALLAELDGVSALFVWSGGEWIGYSVVRGLIVPGSIDADITRDTVLWLAA